MMMKNTTSLLLFLCLALVLNHGLAQWNPPWGRQGNGANPWIPPWVSQPQQGNGGNNPWIPPWVSQPQPGNGANNPWIPPWVTRSQPGNSPGQQQPGGNSPNTAPSSPSPPGQSSPPAGKRNCHYVFHEGNPYSYSWSCDDDSSPGGQSSRCTYQVGPNSYSYSCGKGNNSAGVPPTNNPLPSSSGFNNLPPWLQDWVKELQQWIADPSKPFPTPSWLKPLLQQQQPSPVNPNTTPAGQKP